jgi:V8-like Glu-specific endopeptidase
LRPVTVVGNYEYVGAPSTMDAEPVLARLRAGASATASAETSAADLAKELRSGVADEATMFGADDRETVTNTTLNPYSAQVAMWHKTPTGRFGCSATLIGATTAIAAAHCFHTGAGGSWRPTLTWAAGARASVADSYPYGQVTGCYTAYLPAAFITSDSESPQYDYAVIDFAGPGGCGYTPGATAGHLLWGNYPDADIDQNTAYLFGYPTASSGPYPVQRGMGVGAGAVNLSSLYPDYVFYSYLDTSDGQSGAALFQNIHGGFNAVAIHVGPWDSDEDVARRITSDVAAFITANSVEY